MGLTQQEIDEYVHFMYDEGNEYNCQNCPENKSMDDWQNRLPCGQQNWWVTCHCSGD